MTALVDGVVKLIKAEFGYDLLDALTGFENAEKVITGLLTDISTIITGTNISYLLPKKNRFQFASNDFMF